MLVAWGDRGQAAALSFRYRHPRTGEVVTVEQAVRGPGGLAESLPKRGPAKVVCWGVLRSGLLQHPVLAFGRPAAETD